VRRLRACRGIRRIVVEGRYFEIRFAAGGLRVTLVIVFCAWSLGGLITGFGYTLAAHGAGSLPILAGALSVYALLWLGGIVFLGIASLLAPSHATMTLGEDPRAL
jgi:hypothetical protein